MQLAFEPSGSIAPGDTVTVNLVVQVRVFYGKRLVVSKTVAPFFLINSVRVGTASVLDTDEPTSAEQFSSEDTRGGQLRFPKAFAGTRIQANVTNMDTLAHAFLASVDDDAC